jgi:DNA-binding beta-propeller fold protein YncE
VNTAPPGLLTEPGTEPEAVIRQARRRQRRRWLAAGVAMAVAAAAAAAVIAGSGAGSRPRPPGHHSVPAAAAHGLPAGPAHAAALVTVSQVNLPKGNSLSLAAGYRAVWVTGIGVTYQVDESTGRIVRTISTPGTFPNGCGSGVAAGAGAVWVTHGCRGVYRIDPHSGRVTASLAVPGVGDAVAVADGLVWVPSYHRGLLRIQPRTGRVTGRPIPVGGGSWVMVPGTGALWVTSYGGGIVSRVDVATGAVQPFGNLDIEAVGAGSLWTGYVQRIDPVTGSVIASVPVPGPSGWPVPGASQVVFWRGSAWALTVQRSLAVLRIDPAANQVTGKPVPVGKPLPAALAWGPYPMAIAAGPTGLWVLDPYRNLLFHLAIRPAKP